MPSRFHRRFRAGPFWLSVGKRSKAASGGERGAWFRSSWIAARTIAGVPASALSWTEKRRLPPSAIAAPNLQRDGILSRLLWTIAALAFAGLAIVFAATVLQP